MTRPSCVCFGLDISGFGLWPQPGTSVMMFVPQLLAHKKAELYNRYFQIKAQFKSFASQKNMGRPFFTWWNIFTFRITWHISICLFNFTRVCHYFWLPFFKVQIFPRHQCYPRLLKVIVNLSFKLKWKTDLVINFRNVLTILIVDEADNL